MNWFRRLLFRYGFGKPVITAGPVIVGNGEERRNIGTPTEETDADWLSGYCMGRAHGHLEGRQALALELEQEFGIGQEPMTADDARRIRSRQVH